MTTVRSPGETASPEGLARSLIDLRDIGPDDGWLVGAKAASLASLLHAGFPVPGGLVITTTATLGEAELARAVRASDSVRAGPLAVRSSAVAEDGSQASYAGLYDTVLGVEGEEALARAIHQVRSSATSRRIAAYRQAQHEAGEPAPVAVLIQPMVPADRAGVAFTADPLTGDRETTIVTGVRGLGDQLASGEVTPDEWAVHGGAARPRRDRGGVFDAGLVQAVADLARRIEARTGVPQDVEWAAAHDEIVILQARPMTALPASVVWDPGHPGLWLRNFRFGEWLGDPVTPLFESWALTQLESRLHANYSSYLGGFPLPSRGHVVVNGWYYYGGLNGIPTGRAMLWPLLRYILPSLIRQPRRVAMTMPPTARFGVELFYREWRERIQPRYRTAVSRAASRLGSANPEQLVSLIDELLHEAGDYFTSLTAVAGFAAKAELPFARFHRRELAAALGGSHLDFLSGLGDAPPPASRHAVHSLDWFDPIPAPAMGDEVGGAAADRHTRARESRLAAEAGARAHLAPDRRRLAQFERLLTVAQRYGRAREEQAAEFTLPWPLLRRAVLRLGQHLLRRGRLAAADQIFFLTRPEVASALSGGGDDLGPTAEHRRRTWDGQRTLAPPLVLGTAPPIFQRMLDDATEAVRGPAAQGVEDGLVGIPASAGRAQGIARVVRSAADFDRVQPGDVLVASMTTPAWTPLFGRIAAIVTDNGGIGAHASIVAREYGLPAVVGTADATTRLRDGERLEVDGSAGTVRRMSSEV